MTQLQQFLEIPWRPVINYWLPQSKSKKAAKTAVCLYTQSPIKKQKTTSEPEAFAPAMPGRGGGGGAPGSRDIGGAGGGGGAPTNINVKKL